MKINVGLTFRKLSDKEEGMGKGERSDWTWQLEMVAPVGGFFAASVVFTVFFLMF